MNESTRGQGKRPEPREGSEPERRDRLPHGPGGEPEGGHDTRERLLDAGRRLFATRGFAGTSVRALTSEAGANLSAVTYHFESKEGLYRAVLEECMGPLRDRLEAVRDLPVPPMARLELVVRGMFRHLLENPDMPRFMVQELVIGDRPSPEIVGVIRTVLGALAAILEEGQADGSIRPGDPVLQALTVMSQPIYLSVVPAFLRREELRGADLPKPRRSAESHAVAVLRRALLAREEEDE